MWVWSFAFSSHLLPKPSGHSSAFQPKLPRKGNQNWSRMLGHRHTPTSQKNICTKLWGKAR